MIKLYSVALDFDGSLVEAEPPLRFRPGAREFIVAAAGDGVRMWLHSCRCAPFRDAVLGDAEEFYRTGAVPEATLIDWQLFEEMRLFLRMDGVWDLLEVWASPGKPMADLFVDDKLHPPDWLAVASSLGVRLNDGGRGISSALGSPVPVLPAAPV